MLVPGNTSLTEMAIAGHFQLLVRTLRSLELAVAEVFTPWKSANTTNEQARCCPEGKRVICQDDTGLCWSLPLPISSQDGLSCCHSNALILQSCLILRYSMWGWPAAPRPGQAASMHTHEQKGNGCLYFYVPALDQGTAAAPQGSL